MFEYRSTELPTQQGFFLTQQEAKQLQQLNSELKRTYGLSSNVIEVFYSVEGKPASIKTSSFVGIIKVGSKTIQIVPKIAEITAGQETGKDLYRKATRNLLYMLNFTERLPNLEVGEVFLEKVDDHFFEILINLFVNNLLDKMKMKVYREYTKRADNLSFLKGKIQFRDHLIKNVVLKDRFFCSYDEFSEDSLLNRIFNYTTHLLLLASNNFANIKLLEELAFLLSDVSLQHITLADCERIHFSRLNEDYKPILTLCKLFLGHSSVELTAGKINTFSFMIDMNVLFEEFMGKLIKKAFSDRYDSITLQGPRKNLVERKYIDAKNYGPSFRLRPDIVFKLDGDVQMILDTKYKRLFKEEDIEDVSQQDLYQMYAYAHKYDCPSVILLYPRSGATTKKINYYVGDGKTIYIRTVNLCRNLRQPEERTKLRRELEDILNDPIRIEACVQEVHSN